MTQDPTKRRRMSPWLPAMTRNTQPAVFVDKDDTLGHVFTPREIAFSQGWPSIRTRSNAAYADVV
eukprot:4150568-Alexandrium_andersonii.AAC.1